MSQFVPKTANAGALLTQITADVAADVANTTTFVNTTLLYAVRLIRLIAHRGQLIDEVTIYKEIKRAATTPNTARLDSDLPHDWLTLNSLPVKTS